jgi:hypothetical protein
MKNIFASVVLIFVSNVSYAQASLGLACTSESESIPRLLIVNLADESAQYFDFGRASWASLSSTTITDSGIRVQRYSQGKYNRPFLINRIDGSWQSETLTSFLDGTRQQGVCISRPASEMTQVAQDQLQILNQRRAF